MPNKYQTSTGEKLAQSTINTRLRNTYREMTVKMVCEACGYAHAVDHDHTISQKRCKELGMTELIWSEENIVFSCRRCHMDFESYKNGLFAEHKNALKRMTYIAEHDREGFIKRLMYVPDGKLQYELNKLL